ncbi:hypothetical protein G5V59_21150 [Nocardioides sp. W3-2-3]|uniref:hypothetical protein n=1 Tax=Nocardioides convexus TaxID=2712224 RepID=UPI0024182686|nr:hypothetical protein [Nocardioides convexus]NHA01468.1 hypothetical protein [Nocardioides convexus]
MREGGRAVVVGAPQRRRVRRRHHSQAEGHPVRGLRQRHRPVAEVVAEGLAPHEGLGHGELAAQAPGPLRAG